MLTPPLLIFTDLDGTLLDHETYDYAPAIPALARLRGAGVPVVLASSKTAAELAALRHELGLDAVPAIIENGAGVLPGGDEAGAGQEEYEWIRSVLAGLDPDLRAGFAGFGDWGPEEIAARTGLAPEAAALAARRRYSEPGLWLGAPDRLPAFLDALQGAGIVARQGGRFLTLSLGATKAQRMEEVAAQYGHPHTLALGDAPNDAEMIAAADRGVIVANPHGAGLPTLPAEAAGRIRRTDLPGPAGWNLAVNAVLDDLGL